ncbi:MAG TPA: helix-turn-helix transcriptional regulator [Longimicrobiales bacterium]|nr:helix-turn-helix transcriptional regulator [Longimicrobiales bacterium]
MADDVLPPAEFRVLLSLMDGPKHGHGIRVDVRDRTEGRVDMGPGTLYGAIKRLVRRDWILEVDPPAGEGGDGRRRFYRITEAGREAVAGETARMRELLAIATAKRGSVA